MLFVSRGFGWVVPVMAVLPFLLVQLISEKIFGDGYYAANEWTKISAIIIGSISIAVFGYVLNYRKRKVAIDETGRAIKSKLHTLFYIPVEFWAIIIPVAFFWMQNISEQNDAQNMVYIESPIVNDLYSINYKKIFEDTDKMYKYGVMKVISVENDGIKFVLSNVSYNKKSGVSKDIRKGKPNEANYFSSGSTIFTKNELSSILKKDGIYSISRK